MNIFSEPGYLAHNKARQDHLARLGLPIGGKTVLEVGAGVGDHSAFFLERVCNLTITDGRPENVARIKNRVANLSPRPPVFLLDIERGPFPDKLWQIVYCYGLLYHTETPLIVLRNLAQLCSGMLLLETCVSYLGEAVTVREDANDPRCALRGIGNRLPRETIQEELRRYFPFVYMPITQPDHDEFPLDWRNLQQGRECRAIFIASRYRIINDEMLTGIVPQVQYL